MQQDPDIAVYSRDGTLFLVGEIKGSTATNSDWAAHYRRNLFTHGLIPESAHFLLITPSRTYLWSNSSPGARPIAPTAEGDTRVLLSRFLPKNLHSAISSSGLELAVQSWLRDLQDRPGLPPANADEKQLLVDSGLIENIRAGSLTFSPAL